MSDRLETVARLIAEQFPRWADLEVRPTRHSGWKRVTGTKLRAVGDHHCDCRTAQER